MKTTAKIMMITTLVMTNDDDDDGNGNSDDTTVSKDNACTDKAVSVGETRLRWRGGANRQAGHEHDGRSDEGARQGRDKCPARCPGRDGRKP